MSHQVEIKAETSTKKRRLRMTDEDSDGVRIQIVPCVKEQFRHVPTTHGSHQGVGSGFYVPNRAQRNVVFFAEAW